MHPWYGLFSITDVPEASWTLQPKAQTFTPNTKGPPPKAPQSWIPRRFPHIAGRLKASWRCLSWHLAYCRALKNGQHHMVPSFQYSVCVCVYVYISRWVCIHMYVYTRTYVCSIYVYLHNTYIYLCIFACMYMYIHIFMYVCMYVSNVSNVCNVCMYVCR